MGELNKITLFNRGLVFRTREKVVYHWCSTVQEAITVAMEFECAHPTDRGALRGDIIYPNRGRNESANCRCNRYRQSEPEPMNISALRTVPREECHRRNLCFFCKEPGHRMAQCVKRNRPRSAAPAGAQLNQLPT